MIRHRATGKVISTDPSGLKSDTTTWEYDLATGLELRKTYADGKGTVKTYDAYNNLATVTDARGVVATYTYNQHDDSQTESLHAADGVAYERTEKYDEHGRGIGYVFEKNGGVRQDTTVGYVPGGRGESADFTQDGGMKDSRYATCRVQTCCNCSSTPSYSPIYIFYRMPVIQKQ